MEVASGERPALVPIHGIPLIRYFAENWPLVEDFQAWPDDVVISTYPKSGTTWLSEMLDMIYQDCDAQRCQRAPLHLRVPFLEFAVPDAPTGLETLSQAPRPRLIKTHLPVELLPPSFWRQGCKVLYVSRDPRDVAVSYYHFYRMAPVHPHPGPWPHFLEEFLDGKVSYGSWFTHVRGWWAKAATHPVLCLRYEDMKEAPSQQLNRVLTFLGRALPPGGATTVLAATSFATMRANPQVNYTTLPRTVMDHAVSPFLRKGEVGDWMNFFTVAQAEAFDARYQELMAGVEGPPIPPSPAPGADSASH